MLRGARFDSSLTLFRIKTLRNSESVAAVNLFLFPRSRTQACAFLQESESYAPGGLTPPAVLPTVSSELVPPLFPLFHSLSRLRRFSPF